MPEYSIIQAAQSESIVLSVLLRTRARSLDRNLPLMLSRLAAQVPTSHDEGSDRRGHDEGNADSEERGDENGLPLGLGAAGQDDDVVLEAVAVAVGGERADAGVHDETYSGGILRARSRTALPKVR